MNNPNPTSQTLLVVAALIQQQDRILIQQRPPGSWMEGYWEFPGGKVHAGEDPRKALERELLEELGVRCAVGEIEETIHHVYPEKTVLLLFYWCEILSGEPQGLEGQTLEWAKIDELNKERILPADLPLIHRLIDKGQS
ncbi:MAG: 8-oxo-dGTP diphosphatase MutT [Candidatus Omnitrophica bacterium]|nr:8-oxo-dGTP diphosphatase MutT [Candidatus Omnitrophota bacterium]MCA9431944.1 8-oxo-dGTP diphosphatase MutT [Candidatus Omnitrophota bacterium]